MSKSIIGGSNQSQIQAETNAVTASVASASAQNSNSKAASAQNQQQQQQQFGNSGQQRLTGQGPQTISSSHSSNAQMQGSKFGSSQVSASQSLNNGLNSGLFTPPSASSQIQNQNNTGAARKLHPQSASHNANRKPAIPTIQDVDDEEEKVVSPMHPTAQPQRPFHSYEMGPLDQNQQQQYAPQFQKKQMQQLQQLPQSSMGTGKPMVVNSMSSSFKKDPPRQQETGEQKLNKRHQMRMTSGDSRRGTPHHQHQNQTHNITRSLIDEGSEDFTNIEEHLQEDTRISCRNAVASSLNQVEILLKQGVIQQNLRARRGTQQSNMSGPSHHASKEETFETSSFFDEGISHNRVIQSLQDGYNIPTIFNTLMFGIDHTKVSDNVRESFSKLQGQRPKSRVSQQNLQVQSKQITPKNHQEQKYKKPLQQQQAQPEERKAVKQQQESKPALSSYITKVDKANPGPILVFDNHQTQNEAKQGSRNPEQQTMGGRSTTAAAQKSATNKNQKQSTANSGSSTGGRQSQLQLVAQQNLKIEQQIEQPETLATDTHATKTALNDEEEAMNQQQQSEDFQSSELHRNHLIQTLQSLQYIKTLPPANKNDIRQRQVRLPPFRAGSGIKKTLIFDLDETLVHCIDDIENNPCDQVIHVTFPNGETVQAGINVRPYAIECLKKANENYQVVVFTASHKAYADVVLDHLDPEGKLIQYRLYRDHCIRTEEGIYIKDLRIITNRQLKDLIIVDNAVYSFGYQLDNGIPIIPFYDDPSDEELMHLIFYFNCLAQCEDVREQNRKAFQLRDLQEIDIAEYLQSMMNQSQNRNDEE